MNPDFTDYSRAFYHLFMRKAGTLDIEAKVEILMLLKHLETGGGLPDDMSAFPKAVEFYTEAVIPEIGQIPGTQ